MCFYHSWLFLLLHRRELIRDITVPFSLELVFRITYHKTLYASVGTGREDRERYHVGKEDRSVLRLEVQ